MLSEGGKNWQKSKKWYELAIGLNISSGFPDIKTIWLQKNQSLLQWQRAKEEAAQSVLSIRKQSHHINGGAWYVIACNSKGLKLTLSIVCVWMCWPPFIYK